MDDLYERVDLARAWATFVGGIVAALTLGSLLFPRRVYDGFIWRYFWGPVVADGNGAECAVRHRGETTFPESCEAAAGYVAEPGYTTVSTVSYAVVLVIALIGVYLLIRRLEIGTDPAGFYAMFPFVLFGGALRVVEDISAHLQSLPGESAATIPFPWSAFIISPFIYFTVFFVTLGAVLAGVALERRGAVDRFQVATAAIGAVVLAVTLAYIGYAIGATEAIGFNAAVPVVTLGGATLMTALTWVAIERFAPEINSGTGYMGALIVWGHLVDGIANVISLDWSDALGIPTYQPKHVVNGLIHEYTPLIQPQWLTDLIGQTWPFIVVKLAAAVFVVWIFDDRVFEESPTYAIVLLITVLAVGLGPGTRDFLRATLGI